MTTNELTSMTTDELKAVLKELAVREHNDRATVDLIIGSLKAANRQMRETERDRLAVQLELGKRKQKGQPVSVGFVGTRNTIVSRRAEIDVWAGDPWYPVLRKLDEDLTELMPDYSLDQVKEKFGGLRYYTSYPEGLDARVYDKADRLIRQAELDVQTLREDS